MTFRSNTNTTIMYPFHAKENFQPPRTPIRVLPMRSTTATATTTPSLPCKKRILMRSHLAMKKQRLLEKPRTIVQREASDATAILTAAQALLSLSPAEHEQQQQQMKAVPYSQHLLHCQNTTMATPTTTPSTTLTSCYHHQPQRPSVLTNQSTNPPHLPFLPDAVMVVTTSSSSSSCTVASDMSDDEDLHPPHFPAAAAAGGRAIVPSNHSRRNYVYNNGTTHYSEASSYDSDFQVPPPLTAARAIPAPVIAPTKSSTTTATPCRYYTGSCSLALPNDEEALSPLHCFMRRYCVEAFTATPQEVATPRYGKSNGRRITTGQVGIRCLHCKHRVGGDKQERAVCFPSSLKNIYHSIETWQRRHSLVCQDIPVWIKHSMARLMQSSRSGAGGRRQYWEESAQLLGIVDTEQGLRFIRPPGAIMTTPPTSSSSTVHQAVTTTSSGALSRLIVDSSNSNIDTSSNAIMTMLQQQQQPQDTIPKFPVVTQEDQELVTGYLFVLLEQMESCQFTEQDRTGGRSKVKDCPVGYPGLQCKHCGGKAGFGRYFPASLQALTSANSDRNICNHIMKCRRCPAETRERLERLAKEQNEKHFKNRRGSRKLFFRRVWQRLHGTNRDDENTTPFPQRKPSLVSM